jgi:hypothetical protein
MGRDNIVGALVVIRKISAARYIVNELAHCWISNDILHGYWSCWGCYLLEFRPGECDSKIILRRWPFIILHIEGRDSALVLGFWLTFMMIEPVRVQVLLCPKTVVLGQISFRHHTCTHYMLGQLVFVDLGHVQTIVKRTQLILLGYSIDVTISQAWYLKCHSLEL